MRLNGARCEATWLASLPGLATVATALLCACSEATKPNVPAAVLLVSGSAQTGEVGRPLAEPLVVKVVDSIGRPIPGISVTWTSTQGGGHLAASAADTSSASATPIHTTTDDVGIASSLLILGQAGGAYGVMASVPGAGSVSFTVSAIIIANTISVGWGYTCALTARGDAYCWGSTNNGTVGVEPALVSGVKLASVTAGQMGACGLASDGTAYCWGYNPQGQLGNGTTAPSATPTPVSGGLRFTSLATGDFNTCGISTGGAAYCWGENDGGQLGDSTTDSSLVPVAVKGGHSFSSLSVAYRNACGVTTGGEVWCWGGSGPSIPALVPGGLSFRSVTVGIVATCGLVVGGAAYCWGYNGFGQLGVGPGTASSSSPLPVAGALTYGTVATFWYHTCAVATGGHAYCWGRDERGELGNGTTGDTLYTPTPVSGTLTFASIATGTDNTCALATSGTAYCWGWNNQGQLGDGTTSDRSAPTRVRFF